MNRLIVVLALLTACGSPAVPPAPETTNVGGGMTFVEIPTPDGRVIPCLVYDGYNGDAISCDWNQR